MGITDESAATGAMIPAEKMNFSMKENDMELITLVTFDL